MISLNEKIKTNFEHVWDNLLNKNYPNNVFACSIGHHAYWP